MPKLKKLEKGDQENVWDSIAASWNKYKTEPFGDKEGVLKKFISDKDKNVLDLGCGSGRNFVKFKGTLYGVDFSQVMLDNAEKNAKRIGVKAILTKSPVYKLEFKDNFFDKALFVATLHCVDTDLRRKKALKELYRVLKPGAKVIMTVWNKDSKRWKNKPKEKLVSWEIDGKKVWRYYYLFSQQELKDLVEKTGFVVLRESFPQARNLALLLEKPKK